MNLREAKMLLVNLRRSFTFPSKYFKNKEAELIRQIEELSGKREKAVIAEKRKEEKQEAKKLFKAGNMAVEISMSEINQYYQLTPPFKGTLPKAEIVSRCHDNEIGVYQGEFWCVVCESRCDVKNKKLSLVSVTEGE